MFYPGKMDEICPRILSCGLCGLSPNNDAFDAIFGGEQGADLEGEVADGALRRLELIEDRGARVGKGIELEGAFQRTEVEAFVRSREVEQLARPAG